MLVSEWTGVLCVGVCTLASLQTYNTIIQTIDVINILYFIYYMADATIILLICMYMVESRVWWHLSLTATVVLEPTPKQGVRMKLVARNMYLHYGSLMSRYSALLCVDSCIDWTKPEEKIWLVFYKIDVKNSEYFQSLGKIFSAVCFVFGRFLCYIFF